MSLGLIKVKRLDNGAKLPNRAHSTDSGADLFALQDHILLPQSICKIGTGIALALPDGYSGIIWGKSSLESLGLKVMAGLIDAPYRGEIIVCLYNLNSLPIKLAKGQKIAQLLIMPTVYPDFIEVTELDETERGVGGFGSTGTI